MPHPLSGVHGGKNVASEHLVGLGTGFPGRSFGEHLLPQTGRGFAKHTGASKRQHAFTKREGGHLPAASLSMGMGSTPYDDSSKQMPADCGIRPTSESFPVSPTTLGDGTPGTLMS